MITAILLLVLAWWYGSSQDKAGVWDRNDIWEDFWNWYGVAEDMRDNEIY